MAPKKKPTSPAAKKRKTTSPASASATKKKAAPSASSSLPTMVTRSSAKSERIRLVEGLKSDSDVRRKAKKTKGKSPKSASRKKKAKPDDAPPKVNEAAGGSGKGKEPDVSGAAEEDAGTEEEGEDDDGDGDGEEEPGGGKGSSVIIMAWDIGLFKRKAEELKDCMGGATPDMISRMNPEKENFPDEQLYDLKLDGNCESREGINWMTFLNWWHQERSFRSLSCLQFSLALVQEEAFYS